MSYTQQNKFDLKILHIYTSVSPSPKKGHGKVAKKGALSACGSTSKGHIQRASTSKRHLFK